MLEKIAWITMLYDFYGQLLTERQRDFVELYYGQNLSLGEIAGEFNVTRQSVHDTLKRAEQLLVYYEDKLGLVTRYRTEREKLAGAAGLLDQCISAGEDDRLKRVKEILYEFMDSGEQ